MTDTAMPPVQGPRGREGFTLYEVLIAMVILAVGLLALEGMAIGAARQVIWASLQTEYTMLASAEVEETLADIRINGAAQNDEREVNGATLTRAVSSQQVAGSRLWRVEVTVTSPAGRVKMPPVVVEGHAYVD